MRRWFWLIGLGIAVASGCQSENPTDCGRIYRGVSADAENIRKEDGGWRFTTQDTIRSRATGDVWVASEMVQIIDYDEEYCPESG